MARFASLSVICLLAVLAGCSRSLDQQFSNDTATHPIAQLPVAELAAAKQIVARELAEPKHAVSLDIDVPWIAGHAKAREALVNAGYVENTHGVPRYTRKARDEASHCGKAGDGTYLCRFPVARETIVSFQRYRRIPTSVTGYKGTEFDVMVMSSPVSRLGDALLHSGSLTCFAPGAVTKRVPWIDARQVAPDTIALPAPLRADKDYELTMNGCPTLEDPKVF